LSTVRRGYGSTIDHERNKRDEHLGGTSMNESERSTHASGDEGSVSLAAWAHQHAPHLSEVSNSNPSAVLGRHNLVAITDDLGAARVVALDFERTTEDDTDTTLLVLGHAVSRESTHQADPEGVTAHAARRTLLGGVPGAVVCALIIGLGVWLITGHGAATAAAAIGGAIFGFYVTAVWSFVIGTGQSQAYQQGFIDPDAADAVIVALHVEDHELIDRARRTVAGTDDVRLFELDARGQLLA
jgi:hypothetical protein